jgi:hypothetical protein
MLRSGHTSAAFGRPEIQQYEIRSTPHQQNKGKYFCALGDLQNILLLLLDLTLKHVVL